MIFVAYNYNYLVQKHSRILQNFINIGCDGQVIP